MTEEKISNIDNNELEIEGKVKAGRVAHQLVALITVHTVFFVFLVANLFEKHWISALIYGIVFIGSLAYIWIQWDKAKYLQPIPFLSLALVGIFIGIPIYNTILFAVCLLFYYFFVFWKKNTVDAILTMVSSAVAFIVLMFITRAQSIFLPGGFVFDVNLFYIAMVFQMVLVVLNTVTMLISRQSGTKITSVIISVLLLSLPSFFLQPNLTSAQFTYTLVVVIVYFAMVVLSAFASIKEDKDTLGTYFGLISSELVGLIPLSYLFGHYAIIMDSFTRALVFDFAIFLPCIFVSVFLLVRYFLKKNIREEFSSYSLFEKDHAYNRFDWFTVISFIITLITALSLNGWFTQNYNLLTALVASVLFLAMSLIFNLRINLSFSLGSTYLFLGLMLEFVVNLQSNTTLFILIGFATVMAVFGAVNYFTFKKEVYTEIFSIVGIVTLMLTTMIYFDYFSLWLSLIWAVLGLSQFAFGILSNKVSLRRFGLIILLIDTGKSIVDVIFTVEAGWKMGVAFIVIAFALFASIFLFRWSEIRERETKEESILPFEDGEGPAKD